MAPDESWTTEARDRARKPSSEHPPVDAQLERAHLDRLLDLFAAFALRDWESWVSHLTDDVEWFPASSLLDGRIYHGKVQALDWVGTVVARQVAYSLVPVPEDAEHAAPRLTLPIVPTIAGPDLPFSKLPPVVYFVFTFSDDKVSALHAHADRSSARRELQGEPWTPPEPIV